MNNFRPASLWLHTLLLASFLAPFLAPALAPAQSFLLTGATVHTVSGQTWSPGQVQIKDGTIAAVGNSLPGAAGRVIDLTGLHLYPGLIAAGTTLGLLEIDAVRATLDTTEVGSHTPDVLSWLSVNPDSELIPVARANGITHVEPVPFGGRVSGQSSVMALSDWTIEDMVVRPRAGLHLDWPAMNLDTTPKEEFRNKSNWKSFKDQAQDRRIALQSLHDFFDEAQAYAQARQNAPDQTSIVPAWEAMRPFLAGQMPLMIHAEDVRQIQAAVNWSSQHRYKIVLYGGRDAWMIADLLAKHQIPVVFDHIFTLPTRDTAPYDVHFKAPSILHAAGVKVIFSQGGRHEAASLRNLPYAAAQAVAFGLPPGEALKGLTLYPAQILGVSDRLGSIEPGKEASLFAADGDILDIRANVKHLWIAGREASLESRHTRLYQKYKSRPREERKDRQ